MDTGYEDSLSLISKAEKFYKENFLPFLHANPAKKILENHKILI